MLDQKTINNLREKDIGNKKLLINGKWVDGIKNKTMAVISPINGKKLCLISDAGIEDINLAVKAARQSFESGQWSNMSPIDRKKILLRLADLIERDRFELAVLGVRDNGTEFSMALKAEPGSAAATFRYYAEAIDKVYGEISPSSNKVMGLIHREAVGVVSAIVPWNMPLMIGAWKLAPALAMGNSVILKPAETASLSLLKLGELACEAGLPDGVLNIVTGKGAVAGKALGMHMDIDVLAFTGSGQVGRQLLKYSAESNLKRVFLELGGKSPNIVFNDASDLDEVAKTSVNGIFRNSGQVCVAASRILIQKDIHDELLQKIVNITSKIKIGDPLNLENDVGAINSENQLNKNLNFLQTTTENETVKIFGGERINLDSGGYYMRPAIVEGVRSKMPIAQQEIFGPVLSVISFDDEADAIRIANGTDFGLSSAVWTSNLSKAHRMVRSIRAGVVHVNTYGGSDLTVPLGGHGQSGNGYDKSLHALNKYTNLKTAWFQL